MRQQILEWLRCPTCRAQDWRCDPFEAVRGEVLTGRIVCRSCEAWCPVVDSIPIVSKTPVLVSKWKQKLREKWGQRYDFSEPKEVLMAPDDVKVSEDQGAQIEFYEHEASRYDAEITDTTFWRAFAKQTIHAWGASPEAQKGMLLEVGCGTGASTTALAKLGCRIVALDICFETAKLARDKVEKLGLSHMVDFVVSEAEDLPFQEGIFSGCIFSGVLHHVSDPVRVLKQISGILCAGGVIYGHENNASAFRFLFDLLMKMKQLWHEEAGTHPLMKAAEVQAWGEQAGLRVRARSFVFLPPHFFNLFPPPVAEKLLFFSNRLFRWIPWLMDQGGLLILTGTKMTKG